MSARDKHGLPETTSVSVCGYCRWPIRPHGLPDIEDVDAWRPILKDHAEDCAWIEDMGPPWRKTEDTSPENLLRLTDMHIARYADLITLGEAGHPMVRIGECRCLLAIWKSIKKKEYRFEMLTPVEQAEVRDAIADEG
jgi:hypothetical protein